MSKDKKAQKQSGIDSFEYTSVEATEALVHVPSAAKKQETSIGAGQGTSITEMYDKYMKLIYLFDVSGSMSSGMAPEDTASLYEWPQDLLKKFRERMKKDPDIVSDSMSAMNGTDPDDLDEDDLDDYSDDMSDGFLSAADIDNLSENELKRKIIDEGLSKKYNIPLQRKAVSYSNRYSGKSKLEAVKDAARRFVAERFKKYPAANVKVFAFDESCQDRTHGVGEQAVLYALDSLVPSGMTDIYGAVDRGVSECKKRPSEVGANHIVLVSDGFDSNAGMVEEKLLSRMLENTVVFDFIYIIGGDDDLGERVANDAVINSLKRVCEKTGGKFEIVSKESDFEKKFIEASKRLCLPMKAS